MRSWSCAAVLGAMVVAGCSDPEPSGNLPPDAGAEVPGVERFDAIAPALGQRAEELLDCTDRYLPPAALTGPDGLGKFGWSWSDLRFTLAWSAPNRFSNRWISSNDDAVPSARVRPQLVPSAGYCLQQAVAARAAPAGAGEAFTAELLADVSPFLRRDTGLDAIARERHTAPGHDFTGGNVLLRAIRGLFELPNPLPGAPAVPAWNDTVQGLVDQSVRHYPEPVQQSLAELVLSIGEAHLLKAEAMRSADVAVLKRIHDHFRASSYFTSQTTFVSPSGGTVVEDLLAEADKVALSAFVAASQSVGRAADRVRLALLASGPIEAPDLKVLTPHGLVVVRTRANDDVYGVAELDRVAIAVDAAGNDRWGTGVGAPTHFWMGASVAIDVAGNDLYGPQTPDIEAGTATAAAVFSTDHGFTQGMGLFGVGMLIDAQGDDDYRASVYAQGLGVFGVGVLEDLSGADVYRLGHMGQGAGFFGLGLLADVQGDDRYRIYALGQGAGKPGGAGLLFDLAGDDDYLGYNAEHGAELPGSGVPNYFNLPSSWAYNDGQKPHYMSLCQGVGWGYRQDWLKPAENWMGGIGALIDLGGGRDRHTADTFSMGQGFVYGFGFLYDDGGDDRYRSFWWGPGAAAHMGVGLFIDEGGNDDLHVTRASGGFGYDSSVAWILDRGGNDTYGGQFHYGEAYTYGLTFFINEGGDDTYNAGGVLSAPIFGGVKTGYEGVKLLGAFLDLGGGIDSYEKAPAGVGDGMKWYLDPVGPLAGQALDPAHHKGIGIDE